MQPVKRYISHVCAGGPRAHSWSIQLLPCPALPFPAPPHLPDLPHPCPPQQPLHRLACRLSHWVGMRRALLTAMVVVAVAMVALTPAAACQHILAVLQRLPCLGLASHQG